MRCFGENAKTLYVSLLWLDKNLGVGSVKPFSSILSEFHFKEEFNLLRKQKDFVLYIPQLPYEKGF